MIPLLPLLLGPMLPSSYYNNIYNTTYIDAYNTTYNDTFTADSDSVWMMKQDWEQNREKFVHINQALHGLLKDVVEMKKMDVKTVTVFRNQMQMIEEELQQMEDSHDEDIRRALRQLTANMERWMDDIARDIRLEFGQRMEEVAEVAEAAEAEAEMYNYIIPAGVAALAFITVVIFYKITITIYKRSVSLTSPV